jgi:Squalene/phytoene synthase
MGGNRCRGESAVEPWTLGAAYERCRQLHARHGRTYYLATLPLPRWKRRHVHALYGFTRYADELVDDLAATLDRVGQAAALRAWGQRLFAGLHGAPVQDPLLPAVLHTVRAFDLDPGDFQRFLDAMAADLTVGGYRTYQELCGYMEGSAAVIGTMLAPILESSDPRPPAPTPASWGWPSSSPTSSATSAKTSSGAGSTCPPRTWPASGSAGPATRSWTAGWPFPATAALVWPAVTGPPPGPPPAPNAGSPSPPPAPHERPGAGRGGAGAH